MYRFSRLLSSVLLLIAVFVTAIPTYAQPAFISSDPPRGEGIVALYENNDCTGHVLILYDYEGSFRMSTYGFNDKARSARLLNIAAPLHIYVYDDSHGSQFDDWTHIEVQSDIGSTCIPTFERTTSVFLGTRPLYRQTFYDWTNLDGKVSLIQMYTFEPF
jgi:hypothetical protein